MAEFGWNGHSLGQEPFYDARCGPNLLAYLTNTVVLPGLYRFDGCQGPLWLLGGLSSVSAGPAFRGEVVDFHMASAYSGRPR